MGNTAQLRDQAATPSSLLEAATRFRQELNLPPGGYVVFFDDHPEGWIATLDRPDGWRPGCLAVGSDGMTYCAVGGGYYSGAHYWKAMNHA